MKPILQAMLIADHVYTDLDTRRKIITGVFHEIAFVKKGPELPDAAGGSVKTPPYSAGSSFCYLSLTSLRGSHKFQLRFVKLQRDRILMSCEFERNAADPLEIVEVVIPIPQLPIDEEGAYAFELSCEDEPLGSFRIQAKDIGSPN